MDVNTTTTIPSVDTKSQSYTQHQLHSENHEHSHAHLPSKTILIAIAAATTVTVLLTIFFVLFLLRRQKSSNKNGATKSDVYSYGVVLLELLTGRIPVDIKRAPGEHVLVSWVSYRALTRRANESSFFLGQLKLQHWHLKSIFNAERTRISRSEMSWKTFS